MNCQKYWFGMTKEQYERLIAPFTNRFGRVFLRWMNRICAGVFYLAYPISILILLVTHDSRLGKTVFIPAVSFLVLSVFRKWINRPRPYEALDITPLLKRESLGASFPSRHIFSAFMIAATISWLTPWGYLLFVPAGLLAIVRVIGGIHYPSDVIAGAVCGLLPTVFYLI